MRLVALGDSITAVTNPCGSGWPTYLSLSLDYFANAGVGGNSTGAMLARVGSDVLPHVPTDVTILGGTNDIAGSVPLATSLANLAAIIDAVRAAGATAWLLTIPPFTGWNTQVSTYNAALPALAAAHGAHLVDIYPGLAHAGAWITGYSCDGVHPSAIGAQSIATTVQKALEAIESSMPAWAGGLIEAWVTTPSGSELAWLDRSAASPFRRFAFSWIRGDTGSCSLEYNLRNALVGATPGLFARGNLIWMRYRGQIRPFVSRGRHTVLDEQEHATDWVAVTGRGARQLLKHRLVWPSNFDESHLDPSKWTSAWSTKLDGSAASGQKVVPVVSTTGAVAGMPIELAGSSSEYGVISTISAGVSVTLVDKLTNSYVAGDRAADATRQWRRFVNREPGEMIWDLISESNARIVAAGGIAISRGAVETTGTGWTQDFRFETILDVVTAVEASTGAIVELVGDGAGGIVYNFYAAPGIDRSASLVFEESADILTQEADETPRTDDDPASWIVGQGVGEGVFAKLAISKNTDATFPVEAFLDASDASNLAMIQAETDAALAQQDPGQPLALKVAEKRYLAWVDYGPCDTVRAIAPSRSIDVTGVIVGLYAGEEDDERVRPSIDLNSPRTEYLLRLAKGQKATTRSLGVVNRQPQGQLVPFPIADSVYFDSATSSITGIYVPDRIYLAIECRLAIDFDQFPMPVSSAASSGVPHIHNMFAYMSDIGGAYTKRLFVVKTALGVDKLANLEIETATTVQTDAASGGSHTHTLTAGASKEGYPASHSVNLKVYLLSGGAWGQVGATITGITDDAPDIDLSAYITGPGRWRIVLQSAAGQPNGGRLGAHLSGYLIGAIQSA
jgi:acyl-CoA thioesterase-1